MSISSQPAAMPPVGKTAQRVTHNDIAKHLGISRSAVTEALHGSRKSNLRPELRLKIVRAAQELNYRPQNITTHSIGFVPAVEALMLETESVFLTKVGAALRERKYRLTLAGFNKDEPGALVEALNPKTVDGVIFSRWYEGRIQDVLAPEIPWVLSSDEDGVSDDVDVVTMDMIQTVENITRYLAGFNHRDFCLVTGPERVGFHRRMIEGLRRGLEQSGISPGGLQVLAVEFDEEIAAPFKQMMGGNERPTAIVAGSSEKALTILYHLRTLGLRVPEDVSVVSIFDSHHFRAYDPVLTATRTENDVAHRAVERLLEKIQNPDGTPQKIRVPGQVIERESVGPCARNRTP